MFAPEVIESLRETAPAKSSFTEASIGVWVGGRFFENAFGECHFLPNGARRDALPVQENLRYIGDGLRNVKGYGGDVLTNPVANPVRA